MARARRREERGRRPAYAVGVREPVEGWLVGGAAVIHEVTRFDGTTLVLAEGPRFHLHVSPEQPAIGYFALQSSWGVSLKSRWPPRRL